ncbi:MAG: hypothetical protein JNK74_08820 [Candidatus Hydrogenedentes bacterium]|nr:hypothetical protein [Candidatus Hydrogenedentota bacterium]
MQLEQIGPSLPHLSIATEQVDVLGRYYDCGMTPHIVLPSYDKIYQVMRFEGLWQMPYLSFQNRMKVCIIGYSLRPDDFHAHALIYPQLVHGSREGYLDVRVIDFAENKKQEDAVRARYKHVVGCKFWFQGFNDASLDFLSQ